MARLRYNGMATGSAGSLADISLSGSHTNSTTTLTFNAALTYDNGTAVPTLSGSDYFVLSILDSGGRLAEIVKVTGYTSGASTATVVRGQEGTSGVAHASGAKVVHSVTSDGLATNFQMLTRTSGDISINNTTYAAVATSTLDLVITGVAAGDVVEYIPNFMVDSAVSTRLAFDVATIVSGSVVNYFGSAASGGSGLPGWYAPNTATFSQVSGSAFYTLQSGDISGGSVTLRLYVQAASTTARKILSSTGNPLTVAARKVQ